MEAMILAAGLGTRLGTITNEVPKALVPVGDKPLLAWVIQSLVAAGATHIVINTHHHEDQIRAFLEGHRAFLEGHRASLEGHRASLGGQRTDGVTFSLSSEPDGPYETGGGLVAAAPLFQERNPFLLHNADILSTIPLDGLMARHLETGTALESRLIASLAVQKRESRRALLFDNVGLLGWDNKGGEGTEATRHEVREPSGPVRRMAFTGIHVVDPAIFKLTDRDGRFSIITLYLELAEKGWLIQPLDVSGEEWFDVGTPERLEEARRRFAY